MVSCYVWHQCVKRLTLRILRRKNYEDWLLHCCTHLCQLNKKYSRFSQNKYYYWYPVEISTTVFSCIGIIVWNLGLCNIPATMKCFNWGELEWASHDIAWCTEKWDVTDWPMGLTDSVSMYQNQDPSFCFLCVVAYRNNQLQSTVCLERKFDIVGYQLMLWVRGCSVLLDVSRRIYTEQGCLSSIWII